MLLRMSSIELCGGPICGLHGCLFGRLFGPNDFGQTLSARREVPVLHGCPSRLAVDQIPISVKMVGATMMCWTSSPSGGGSNPGH
jgi:hypothetical protein